MELHEQEYVLALVRHGSFKKAAEELYVSQPTLSIFLNRLEERLGIPLFERLGKRLVPTYAGEVYARRAREMILIRDQFDSEFGELVTGYSGRIRLGIHSRRSSHLLPRVLCRFGNLHPGMEVTVEENSSQELEQLLQEGSLDLIISNRSFHEEKLDIFPLYQDFVVVCLPQGHPAEQLAVPLEGHTYPWLDLKHLEGERFILQKPAQSLRAFTDLAFQYCQVTPARTFLIENLETAAQMAAEGYGVSFNYQSYICHFQYEKPISCFETGFSDLYIPIYAAVRKGSFLPAHTHTLIRLLLEEFQKGGKR